jgi:hypothetical protein
MNVGNVAAGDTVLVSGTFNETVNLDVPGSATATILVRGDDKSGGAGVGSPAQFTIDGASTRANCLTTALTTPNIFYCFRNMTCTGATADGVDLDTVRHVTFKNCRFTSNGTTSGAGVKCNNSYFQFELCEIDNNSLQGIDGNNVILIGCKIHSNTAEGVLCTAVVAAFCVFYNHSNNDVECNGTADGGIYINCTFDGDGKTVSCIRMDGASHRMHTLVNNVIVGASGTGGYGVECSNNLGETAISLNNLVNNNDNNYSNAETFTGEVTSAPGFTNQGSDDYSLSSGGAVDAGVDASDNTL